MQTAKSHPLRRHSQTGLSLLEIMLGVAISLVGIVTLTSAWSQIRPVLTIVKQYLLETALEDKIVVHLSCNASRSMDVASKCVKSEWGLLLYNAQSKHILDYDNTKKRYTYQGYEVEGRCKGAGYVQVRYRPVDNVSAKWKYLFNGLGSSCGREPLIIDGPLEGTYVAAYYSDIPVPWNPQPDWKTIPAPVGSSTQLIQTPLNTKILCKQMGYDGPSYVESRKYKALTTSAATDMKVGAGDGPNHGFTGVTNEPITFFNRGTQQFHTITSVHTGPGKTFEKPFTTSSPWNYRIGRLHCGG